MTPWIAAHQVSLSITKSWSLLKLMSVELVVPFSYLRMLCCPLHLLPPIPPSVRVFFNESTLCIRWPKYWSFSFKISPSNIQPGLISFSSPCIPKDSQESFQHHSSKVSILQCTAFFTVQLSHLYMTTGKTIALTRWTFVGKVMSPLFNCCLGRIENIYSCMFLLERKKLFLEFHRR